MPNEFQFQCFFNGPQLAKLCEGNEDIIVTATVSYPFDEKPTFQIFASAWTEQAKTSTPPPPVPGCPSPCH